MSTAMQPRYSPREYLALERAAEHKSEYVNGEIYAMAGATRAHNLLAGNAFAELRARLRGRPCEVYINDMRVKVSETGPYTYPDVAALCEAPRFEDSRADTLLNPSVIVEVLSESTERYDRGEKFAHYRRLESVREYVLVSQDRMRVELYTRQAANWLPSEFGGPDAEVPLPSLGCAVALRDLYERITFAEPAAAPAPSAREGSEPR